MGQISSGDLGQNYSGANKVVQQRLKLAIVSPKLIALYRKNGMSLDCLMAFTITDSHKQQENVWKELPDWARQEAGRRGVLAGQTENVVQQRGRAVELRSFGQAERLELPAEALEDP